MGGPVRKRVAVLISGRGSNLTALIEAAASPDYPAEIVVVISSRQDAPGLEVASSTGIRTAIIEPGLDTDRHKWERDLHDQLKRAEVDIVCLAGYMQVLSADFVRRWQDRIINIHPSLLPSFRGLDTHERALQSGIRIHGATVHVVRAEVDDGPIIAQAAVSVHPDDTADSLATRVLRLEHLLYPQALAMFASGRARLVGARIEFADAPGIDPGTLFSPPID